MALASFTVPLPSAQASQKRVLGMKKSNPLMGSLRRAISIRAAKSVDVPRVKPQADRVLIRLEQLPEKSSGGVLLPKSSVKFENYLVGEWWPAVATCKSLDFRPSGGQLLRFMNIS